jgi:hypothetical protein
MLVVNFLGDWVSADEHEVIEVRILGIVNGSSPIDGVEEGELPRVGVKKTYTVVSNVEVPLASFAMRTWSVASGSVRVATTYTRQLALIKSHLALIEWQGVLIIIDLALMKGVGIIVDLALKKGVIMIIDPALKQGVGIQQFTDGDVGGRGVPREQVGQDRLWLSTMILRSLSKGLLVLSEPIVVKFW